MTIPYFLQHNNLNQHIKNCLEGHVGRNNNIHQGGGHTYIKNLLLHDGRIKVCYQYKDLAYMPPRKTEFIPMKQFPPTIRKSIIALMPLEEYVLITHHGIAYNFETNIHWIQCNESQIDHRCPLVHTLSQRFFDVVSLHITEPLSSHETLEKVAGRRICIEKNWRTREIDPEWDGIRAERFNNMAVIVKNGIPIDAIRLLDIPISKKS